MSFLILVSNKIKMYIFFNRKSLRSRAFCCRMHKKLGDLGETQFRLFKQNIDTNILFICVDLGSLSAIFLSLVSFVFSWAFTPTTKYFSPL